MTICAPCIEHPQEAYLEVGGTQVKLTACAAHLALTAEIYSTGTRIRRSVTGYPATPQFRCPKCLSASASAWDAIFGFCGRCKAYTG